MRKKPHGKGMTHKQVVKFSNRLAYSANHYHEDNNFINGWEAACRYFAHELRKDLRYYENIND